VTIYIILGISIILNGFLIWYVIKLLRKFMFISANISDLYLTTKAFQVFVSSLYSMESYHGEPIIQELVLKIKEVGAELESFRDVFIYTLDEEIDEELEGELNGTQEETNQE